MAKLGRSGGKCLLMLAMLTSCEVACSPDSVVYPPDVRGKGADAPSDATQQAHASEVACGAPNPCVVTVAQADGCSQTPVAAGKVCSPADLDPCHEALGSCDGAGGCSVAPKVGAACAPPTAGASGVCGPDGKCHVAWIPGKSVDIVDSPDAALAEDAQSAADTTDVVAAATDSAGTDAAPDAKVSAADSAQDAPTSWLCTDKPADAAPPVVPMAYAAASGWQAGKLACGSAPPPFFWASADMPAPVTCTTTCAPSANAESTLCAGGLCLVARCAPGWQDRDAWAGNGCEASVPVACDLYVDATALGAPGQDGSAAHPFAGLSSALCAVQAGCVIHLAAGDYAVPWAQNGGSATLDKAGIVLRGAGPDVTRIIGQTNENTWLPQSVVQVTADDVVLEGLAAVNGGHFGVRLQGKRPILRNVAVGPVGSDALSKYPGTGPAIGIDLAGSTDARLSLVWVHDIGTSGVNNWMPAGASGISGGTGVRVAGARVDHIHAESSCTTAYGSGYAPNPCTNATLGGDATGIAVDGLVSGSAISDVVAGYGGVYAGYGATGLKNKGGTASPDGAWNPLAAGHIDATDSMDGNPVLMLDQCHGGEIQGFTLGTAPPIRVTNSSGVTIAGNSLAGPGAAAGHWHPGIFLNNCAGCKVSGNKMMNFRVAALQVLASPEASVIGNVVESVGKDVSAWGPALPEVPTQQAGVVVSGSSGCKVSWNTIKAISGGSPYIGQGFSAVGLRVEGSSGCVIAGNDIQGVTGGVGVDIYQAGPGGDAVGIRVVGCPGAIVVGNGIAAISGGSAVNKATMPKPTGFASVPGGAGIGIQINGSASPLIQHNAIGTIQAGGAWTGIAGVAATDTATCLDLHGGAIVEHLTCAGSITGITNTGGGTVSVTNSIFINLQDCGTIDTMSWSDLWAVAACTVAKPGPGMLNVDPLLTADLHLQPTSPAIDAADPGALYCLEPKPNGCRADMGAYGNTAGATSNAGASQCACP